MSCRTILLWPDTHIPYQDKRAVDNLFSYIVDNPPDEILFLGDLYDFLPVARWSKDTIAECGKRMQAEADAGEKFFLDFRSIYDGKASCLLGNHELRWNNYLSRYAPGLFGMRDLTLEKIFHFAQFNVPVITKQPYMVAPGVSAIHGKRLSQKAGDSAFKERQRHGTSIVQGHSHRLGIIYETTDKRRFAAECGWLGDIRKAAYLDFEGVANWQSGWGLLTVNGNEVTPELIPVQPNGSFTVRGVRYDARG